MTFIYRLFHQDPESRDSIITMTSGLGIVANIVIATTKVILGALASSIAIISEGVNNYADVLTSVLTLVGAKLAKKHPDEEHPFGYGRIEYLASLVITVFILVTGIEMVKSSVELIFEPAELNISYFALAIVALTAVAKFTLGVYTIRMGEKADSSSLKAVGVDCRGDAFASLMTIAASLVFLLTGVSLDAYAGLFISFLILKAGYEILKDTVSDLLGRPGEEELAKELYQIIRHTDGILGAADMMLHNYGPDAWSGSVNVEIDHNKTVGEIYAFLHELQLRIMYEYKVVLVFGVYAVDNDLEEIKQIRKNISKFMQEHEHIKSFHAVYLDSEHNNLYCDFIVDYALKDWDGLDKEFKDYMAILYPDYDIILTIETEFV